MLKFTSTGLVMLSNHLILCRPFLLLLSIFPSIRVFSPLIREQKKISEISENNLLQVVGGLEEVHRPLKVGMKSGILCQVSIFRVEGSYFSLELKSVGNRTKTVTYGKG